LSVNKAKLYLLAREENLTYNFVACSLANISTELKYKQGKGEVLSYFTLLIKTKFL